MPETQRGDVWLVDLGLAPKVRPCLVLSVLCTVWSARPMGINSYV